MYEEKRKNEEPGYLGEKMSCAINEIAQCEDSISHEGEESTLSY